jgi:hypothetical protein
MDIIDATKCNEFKHILSGCRNILDAYYFAEIYSKRCPEMKHIFYSMCNGKRYDKIIDYRGMKNMLEDFNEHSYKDDYYIDDLSQNTIDENQINSIKRINNNKIVRPIIDSTIRIEENEIIITKQCPHCKTDRDAHPDTKYIICGFVSSRVGYDWKGCGKDWCFGCGKMLCKSWNTHKLFLEENRTHDKSCCSKHAEENNYVYPDDYCMCVKN